MALPSIPTNYYLQTGNSQNYLNWDLVLGATSYQVQRSLDNVTYTNYATVVVNNYLDSVVVNGTQYFYQVAAINASGMGLFTSPQSCVPTMTSELSLGALRLAAQQRADLVGSNFVSVPEWNSYINQSIQELYDLLVTSDEEFFIATPIQFVASPNSNQTYLYPLPDGVASFTNGIDGVSPYTAPAFYKLKGVDLGLNTANNAWVTINKFSWSKRNTFVYPNTASTIYGVFNLQYRLVGNSLEFIPTPSSGQIIRVWYIPRLQTLLKDSDVTSTSISGWIEYVIVDAAIKAMQKEESDVSVLAAQKMALKARIEETAANRDTGQPDTISDMRAGGYGNGFGGGSGWNGNSGGY